MAEGDRTNNDAADIAAAGGDNIEEGGAAQTASGAEAAGGDPAGFEPSGVGDPQRQGDGGEGGASARAGDWNPGEQGGGGGELY